MIDRDEHRPGPVVPTIVDVAQAAGVSVATVSRVLNDHRDVAAGTRQRVRRTIAELGFTPQITARRLVSSRSRTLALLFPSAHAALTSFEVDFVVGAAGAAAERDHVLSLIVDDPSEARLLDLYRSRLVDGAILMQIQLRDRRVELLDEHRLPFVMIGRTENPRGLSYVDFDFAGAVVAIYDFLTGLGHRRIACIGRPAAQVEAGLGPAVRVVEGLARATRELGIEPLLLPTDLDPLATAQATLHLLDEYPDLTAIVTTSGPPSAGVLRALAERGCAVPDDVSVVGIATDRVAELMTPPLSAAAFPSAPIGHQAVSMLVRLLDDWRAERPSRVEQIVVPASITVRGTSAPRQREE